MIRSIATSLLLVSGANAAAPAKSSYISEGANPQLMYQVDVPAEGQQSSTLNGSSFDNCIRITDNFNFHWAVRDGMFKAAHEGFGDDGVYFAFAIVADPNAPNRMAGSDAVVTSFNQNSSQMTADDYFMNAVQECNEDDNEGVCPDREIDRDSENAVFNVSGFLQDGIHVVSYIRPLNGSDDTDLDINPDVAAFYLFAQGPMNADGYPMYHMANRGAVEIELNREPSFQCTQLLPNGAATTAPTPTRVLVPGSASTTRPEYLLAALLFGTALL